MGRAWGWVWFLALVVALGASNPGPRAYQGWLQDEISTHSNLGPTAVNRLAGFIEGAIAGSGQHTTRTNLGVASVYRTQVAGNRIAVAAIAGRFLLVSQSSGNPASSSAGR